MNAAAVEAGLPTRSQIERWSTAHLDAAATHWEKVAAGSQAAFSAHVSRMETPGATQWSGGAATAAYNRARDAQEVVTAQCAITRDCVAIARRGGDDIRAMQRVALEAISEAEENGFAVADDLSLIDTKRAVASTSDAAQRSIEGQHLPEFIRWRASHLVQVDDRVANELAAKASELERLKISGRDSTVHMLSGGSHASQSLSEARRRAVEYADQWADGANPEYRNFGVGHECANFVSQAMRAGGFQDVGPGITNIHGGASNQWYYQETHSYPVVLPWGQPNSTTWALARENHNFVTQHSGRGSIVGVVGTPVDPGSAEHLPDKTVLGPLAPSQAGLVPGDLIYYKENTGEISHVAMYVGQQYIPNSKGELVLTDVVDQHAAGDNNFRNDWMPDSADYGGGRAEFVHLNYPGD